jgi:hypothetical protein
MKLSLIVLLQFFLTFSIVMAQSNTTLAEEFTKLDDFLRNPKQTPEQKKRIFETNVLNSLRNTLAHKYANPKKDLKDLKFQDLQTERPEGTNNLYVKYKNFFISYSFIVDPELYLTSPIDEVVLEKPTGADLNASHEDKPASPSK